MPLRAKIEIKNFKVDNRKKAFEYNIQNITFIHVVKRDVSRVCACFIYLSVHFVICFLDEYSH